MRLCDHHVGKGLHSLREGKWREVREGLGVSSGSYGKTQGRNRKGHGFEFALGLGVVLGSRALDTLPLRESCVQSPTSGKKWGG